MYNHEIYFLPNIGKYPISESVPLPKYWAERKKRVIPPSFALFWNQWSVYYATHIPKNHDRCWFTLDRYAEMFEWSRSQIHRFIQLAQSLGMIECNLSDHLQKNEAPWIRPNPKFKQVFKEVKNSKKPLDFSHIKKAISKKRLNQLSFTKDNNKPINDTKVPKTPSFPHQSNPQTQSQIHSAIEAIEAIRKGGQDDYTENQWLNIFIYLGFDVKFLRHFKKYFALLEQKHLRAIILDYFEIAPTSGGKFIFSALKRQHEQSLTENMPAHEKLKYHQYHLKKSTSKISPSAHNQTTLSQKRVFWQKYETHSYKKVVDYLFKELNFLEEQQPQETLLVLKPKNKKLRFIFSHRIFLDSFIEEKKRLMPHLERQFPKIQFEDTELKYFK